MHNIIDCCHIDFCRMYLADLDYRAARVMLTFDSTNPGMRCTIIQIFSDNETEEQEQFSVILTSVSPDGIIMEDTACITIIDEPIEIRRLTSNNLMY